MAKVGRDREAILLLMASRTTRSFAAGFLGVVIGLYYLNALHLSALLIGTLFGAGAFATPLFSYLLGRYADSRGRKKALLIALAFLPASVLILILTTYLPLLLLSASLGGFGIAGGLIGGGVGASVAPMQTALLAENTSLQNRTRVFSIFQMLSTLAGSAGALLSYISDYSELFYLALALSLVSLLVVVPLREKAPPPPGGSEPDEGRAERDSSTIKKFVVTGAFSGMTQGFYVPFLPIVFSAYFHVSNGQIGEVFALGGLLSALAISFTPYMTRRLGFVPFIMASRAVAAVFCLLIPFATSAAMAFAFYLVSTPTRSSSIPSQSSFMMGLVSEGNRATASGSNQAARLGPAALSTVISGYLQDILPISVPFIAAFILGMSNVYLYRRFFGGISLDQEPRPISPP